MKYLFMFVFLIPISVEARQICIDVPDTDIQIAEDSVINFDQWVIEAIRGKINNSKERIIRKETQLSIENNESLPAGKDAIVQKHFNRIDYKNRTEREAEAKQRVENP